MVLGVPDDPWGHQPAITCTDQPNDQIVGVISAGPDGKPGTADDIASWQLDRGVTELVRGTRWTATRSRPARKPAVLVKPSAGLTPAKPAAVRAKPLPAVQLDENGMPTKR
jgi:hypothetical protein